MTDSNGHDPDQNIFHFPSLAERQRMQREEMQAARPKAPPMLNLPPVTKAMLLVLIAVQLILSFGVSGDVRYDLYQTFGFVPAVYTGHAPFHWQAITAPFTYMLLHGGWMHLVMNGLMLMAFGAGVERWMGSARMLVYFILCGLAAAAAHLMLNPFSEDPVIGASGALSGLFAAVLVMMNGMRAQAGMPAAKMLPFVILWIALTVGSGLMGAPTGDAIAWAAHVGGFLAGFLFLKLMRLA